MLHLYRDMIVNHKIPKDSVYRQDSGASAYVPLNFPRGMAWT